MPTIIHNYEIGDTVMFKAKFNKTASCDLIWRAGTVAEITGIAPSYNNKPHYYTNGITDEVFPESAFAGRYEEV